jgi:hypothetical protein
MSLVAEVNYNNFVFFEFFPLVMILTLRHSDLYIYITHKKPNEMGIYIFVRGTKKKAEQQKYFS